MTPPPHLTSRARGTYGDDRRTPAFVLDAVRRAAGVKNVFLDLASSDAANESVRALHYYTADKPCPALQSAPQRSQAGRLVWCNPPGPVAHVQWFWAAWNAYVARGALGAFLLFNIDHWRQVTAPTVAAEVVVVRRRLPFTGPGCSGAGASFASALVCAGFSAPRDLGHVVSWVV